MHDVVPLLRDGDGCELAHESVEVERRLDLLFVRHWRRHDHVAASAGLPAEAFCVALDTVVAARRECPERRQHTRGDDRGKATRRAEHADECGIRRLRSGGIATPSRYGAAHCRGAAALPPESRARAGAPGRPSGGEMIAAVRSATIVGARGHPVNVEVHVAKGIPAFSMLGLPDESCREARDRVRAAIITSGFGWSDKKITV